MTVLIKDPLEKFFGDTRAMGGQNNDPDGNQYLQRITKSTTIQILDEKRVNIFALKEPLEADLHKYDIDNEDVIDMKIDIDDENHDLTDQAKEIGLKVIAGKKTDHLQFHTNSNVN